MKTQQGWISLCGKALILACLVTSWALSFPAFAQDDRGDSEVAKPAEDAADPPTAAETPRSDKRAHAKPQGIPTRLSDLFRAGGPMMWPLAACSVIVVAFAIERQVLLRRRRVIPKDFVTRFLEHLKSGQLDRASALELCEKNGSPIAQVFAHGVRKWGKPSVEVEQAIIDGGERQIGLLRKHLRVMNTVATVAPLMGLLGTVYGMILCFNELATSTAVVGKTEELAKGIGMALVATGGGLVVAIPSLILYMYLAGRVDAVVMEMDLLAQKVVHLISAEGLASHPGEHPRLAPRPKTIGTGALKNS
jgi:biopolymer transport protein ExbB